MVKFQPVIKWSGSKRSQSEAIVKYIDKNKKYDTYYEPFCGGCSVLYQVLKSGARFKNYICSDLNDGLISLWNLIKENPKLIATEYKRMWNELNVDDDKERKKQYYYSVRKRFNEEKNPIDFMFIMRTTTNGMPRYNSSGEFNNSFHVTRNGITPDKLEKLLYEWSELLNNNNVQFINRSYDEIQSNENDFVYLDPPYANTKGMYYGTIDYEKLWNWLRQQKGECLLSFDGKTSSIDVTYDVPKDIYNLHTYLYSGNSSFRRVIGTSNSEYVQESLYIKLHGDFYAEDDIRLDKYCGGERVAVLTRDDCQVELIVKLSDDNLYFEINKIVNGEVVEFSEPLYEFNSVKEIEVEMLNYLVS